MSVNCRPRTDLSIACGLVSPRNRIVVSYTAFAIAALGTTLTWASRGDVAVNGQTVGLNGGLVMVLCLVSAGLITWWDRGSRMDLGRIRMAIFVAFATLAIVVRNAYNVAIGDIFGPDVNIGYGLWISLIGTVVGLVTVRSLMTR